MVTITRELLRRRAEHNDGDLSNLEEITLHQFDIERIELVQEACRKLRILYLQSNQIMKIENLGKLKCLEYLNLALNNIRLVENLQGCESLRKLDLTVNFVEDVRCVESLRGNAELTELFLTGNLCTQKPGYRAFVIATLPQLQSLDGTPITKSERISAEQEYAAIKRALDEEFGEQLLVGNDAETVMETVTEINKTDAQEQAERDDKGDEELIPHTPEARLAAARELAAKRSKHDPSVPPPGPKQVETPPVKFHEDGRIIQRNSAKLEFHISELGDHVTIEVALSPFLDTSLVELQVERTWVRLVAKGKPLDIALPTPVDKDRSSAVRSQTTGKLVVRMLKEGAEDQVEQPSFTGYVAGSKKNTASAKENTGPVDYRNIIANNLAEAEKRAKAGVASAIQLSRNGMPRPEAIERRRQAEMALASGGAADDDVPPLE